MIYRARMVIPMNGEPIENGAVAVRGDRIEAVGSFSEIAAGAANDEVVDLGEMALLPGLINAHCHLDYTMMRGAISPQNSFSDWVRQINMLKAKCGAADYLTAIGEGFLELQQWGTTTVLNIEAFPQLLPMMLPPPIRTWWFYEMIDLRQFVDVQQICDDAKTLFADNHGWPGGFGLSPHAPYTVSSLLLETTKLIAREEKIPVTIHVAESHDEMLMFSEGRGSLYDFLSMMGRDMSDCGLRTPLAHTLEYGDEDWLFAHLNELSESDFALIANRKLNVAHCPKSRAYFDHAEFPLKRLQTIGVNICIGTDSLASNDSLSLFSEMQTLAKAESWLSARELLEMATRNAAQALGLRGSLGEISPNAYADLIAVPCGSNLRDVYEQIVHNQSHVPWVMADGRVLSAADLASQEVGG